VSLDPSKATEQFAANDAAYDDDPTAELGGAVTCELDEQYIPVSRPDAAPRAASAPHPEQAEEPAAAAVPTPGIGTVLRGRYVLEEVVGTGGFSTVYRARDLRREDAGPEDHRVAIKLLRPEFAGSVAATSRLKRESRQLRVLSHPGIVRLFDLDCHDGCWFEVMELLRGQTLSSLLRRRSAEEPLPLAAATDLLRVCAGALEHAHAHGVVHGDLKPGNIFIRDTGEACLLDFGSVPDSAEEDRDARRVGTVGYSSPEVLRGLRATPADDVYSLACIALELLTGLPRSATERADGAILRKEIAGLSSTQAAALGAAFAADRAVRPVSPQLFFDQLAATPDAAVTGPPSETRTMDVATTVPEPPVSDNAPATRLAHQSVPPRRWLLLPLALLFTVTVAAGLWFRVGASEDPSPGTTPVVSATAPVSAEPTPSVAARVERPSPARAASIEPSNRGQARPARGTRLPSAASTPPPRAALAPVSTVSFRAPAMTVSRLANVAAIELRRDGPASGRSRVAWQISEDSASAGRDLDGPLSGEEVFVDGQRARVLFLPIRGDADGRSDRSFTVSLWPLEARTALGEQSSIRVTIRSPEDVPTQVTGR